MTGTFGAPSTGATPAPASGTAADGATSVAALDAAMMMPINMMMPGALPRRGLGLAMDGKMG